MRRLLVAAAVGILGCASFGTPRHSPELAVGRFAPCPRTPNCVSTQADPSDAEHYVEPLPYREATSEAVRARVAAILAELPRARIVAAGPRWFRLEVRSALFRFVDDVELYLDDAARRIHFRSASRLGYGDLGVNRRRYRWFRERYLGR